MIVDWCTKYLSYNCLRWFRTIWILFIVPILWRNIFTTKQFRTLGFISQINTYTLFIGGPNRAVFCSLAYAISMVFSYGYDLLVFFLMFSFLEQFILIFTWLQWFSKICEKAKDLHHLEILRFFVVEKFEIHSNIFGPFFEIYFSIDEVQRSLCSFGPNFRARILRNW